MNWLDQIKWDAQGLVPVIAQEVASGDVLMLAWMNREALQKTAELGRAVYYSRSRAKLWFKGEESGQVQTVHEIRLDCDADVILLRVSQPAVDSATAGAAAQSIACHTGRHSCFFNLYENGAWKVTEPVLKDPQLIYNQAPMSTTASSADALANLAQVIRGRLPQHGGNPETSYVARLLHQGPDAFLKKIGEEATEVVMAAKDADAGGDRGRIVCEVADLWFHCMIALAHYGYAPADVVAELQRRAGVSGIEEKALRKVVAREGASQ